MLNHKFSKNVCLEKICPVVQYIMVSQTDFTVATRFLALRPCNYPDPFYDKKKQTNSVALVRERTIPTERPPPVGEVSANFLRIEGCHVVSATDPHGR